MAMAVVWTEPASSRGLVLSKKKMGKRKGNLSKEISPAAWEIIRRRRQRRR
jgi:hypothetical protein